MTNIDESWAKLHVAGVFCDADEDDPPELAKMINLSDTFAWGCADAEPVPDEEMATVADLYHRYGWCGILYWVNERRGRPMSEFTDINRFIEFVRVEETIRKEEPNDDKRAYLKRKYTIGVEE